MNFSGTITSDFLKLADIPIDKRPSLINFAATDFITLRNSLIDYSKAVYPRDYSYFVESDLGMMFIELVAYMGSVMSMKADMLANENFLATATQRPSIKKLLELIGIRMKGPLSAAADAKLTSPTPVIAGTGNLTIGAASRVVETTSPQDGGALVYTLYKVVNGLVDTTNSTGDIVLEAAEGEGSPITVFENIVLQEGTLVKDSGSFASTEGIKTIKLTQGPVIEGSVQVYTEGPDSTKNGAFVEVPSVYFASGSSDKIFEVVYDDDYKATIVFGDGSVGVSPDNTSNYIAFYRVGGGSRGNIAKGTIDNSITCRVDTVATSVNLTNTTKGTGGSNAETLDHAKRYAPLNFRRQDRLVTLEDYSVFSNTFISTFGTVGKATAAVRKAYSSANIVDIYILEKASDVQLQRATTNFKTQLLEAIDKKRMATDDVVIVDGLIRTLDLVTTIRIDREEDRNQDQIKARVRDKIMTYMNVDNREFGQNFNIAETNRQIFEVDEVRYSTLDNVEKDITIDFNEIVQLNNLTINIELLD
jgi:predicted phage baseplate assembly protein